MRLDGPVLSAPEETVRRDPERTRQAILDAAIGEFAEKGLDGARVNEIAARAGTNKRMLYHYFGNKEALYLASLERVYETIRRKEQSVDLDRLAPEDGVRELVRVTWQHFQEHPEFIALLNTENLHKGRYLRQSRHIRELHSPLVSMLARLLERGARAGVFRQGVDPVQLYISMAALGYFYLSNRHTLSTIFDADLETPEALDRRLQHMSDFIMGYLRA